MMLVRTALITFLFVVFAECKLSDVPDNVQLQKDSDINLMEVLESLAPVPSDEEAAIKPKGEGIERFRRLVEPATGSGLSSDKPDLPAPKESSSIFSQRKSADGPLSGDGEWDSGNGAGTKTKKSEINGEDASGSGEEDAPVVMQPEASAAEPAVATSLSSDEGSAVAQPATVSLAGTEKKSSSLEPPPVPSAHSAEQRASAPTADAVSFNAEQQELPNTAEQLLANKTASVEPDVQTPVQESQETSSANAASTPASGVGEGAHPVALDNQEHVASGAEETSGSGLNADELAFIAGLQKAKEHKEVVVSKPEKKSKLPGSVGSDEEETDDDSDSESGDLSGEESYASGSQDDDTISSGSAEDEDIEGHQRSDVNPPADEDTVEDSDQTSSGEGSGSASDEDDSEESVSGDVQRRDTILNVESGSGVSFLSGVGDSEDDEGSVESSGEDDTPEDDLPGSIGEVDDIEKLEQQKAAKPATATGFSYSSGSGATATVKSEEPAAASGSGEAVSNRDSAAKTVQSPTLLESANAKPISTMQGSGEPETSEFTLPGSVGGLTDLAQLASQSKNNADAEISGSGESKPNPSLDSPIVPGESLMQQLLPDASSGSGESVKEEETLPGSFGDELNLEPNEKASDSQSLVSSGSGDEGVHIINPVSSAQEGGSGSVADLGSGESLQSLLSTESSSSNKESASNRRRSQIAKVEVSQVSDGSGSGTYDQQLSGSGTTENLATLETAPSDEESLPGSVGAVGPNLMTMASPEHKAGSGLSDQSGSGSGFGSGLLDQAGFGKEFQLFDSSASGSGETEGSGERVAKDTVARVEETKPLMAVANESSNATEKDVQTPVVTEQKPSIQTISESSGGFGLLDTLAASGSGFSDELLPGGVGNAGSADLQSLAGSGEDASGFTFRSGLGSDLDLGLSGSGSAFSDVISGSSGNSGSGNFVYEPKYFADLSKKDYAPTASASASVEQDSGSGSASGARIVPLINHTYVPTPKKVGIGFTATTLSASASGSSGQYSSSASANGVLPGSVGVEESFSSSGSAIFDASTSFDEGSSSGFLPNIAEFPSESMFDTDVAASASGVEVANVVESGAGEGSGAQTIEESSGEGFEETSQRSHTGKLTPFSFNLNSALQDDMGPGNFARIPVTLDVGSGSSYGLGSGTGVDYGSASDFLSGSAGSGTLELTPATSPSEAIVNLFGSAFGTSDKEGESEASSSTSSATLSGEGSSAKHRHHIPVSGDDITTIAQQQDQVEYDLPQPGQTVDQQLLDRFMISQILEQNLTLFYGGLAGRPGKQGPEGAKGAEGMQGMAGPMGPPGAVGDVGAPGADGELGPMGPPGLGGMYGFKGEQGPPGQPGLAGEPGAPGVPGSGGDVGPVGPEAVMPNCSYICEGEKTWLQCKQYELIKINRAFWGREENEFCPEAPIGLVTDKPCETDPENTFKKVESQCRNNQACEIVASNTFFDDPTCKNTFKYLKLCYECIPDEVHTTDVLLDQGKRRKRGTRLEDVLRKRREKSRDKLLNELWQHPYHARLA